MSIAKEISDMHVIYRSKAFASNFSSFFTLKTGKIAQDKCSHCAMALDNCVRLLLNDRSVGTRLQFIHILAPKVWGF